MQAHILGLDVESSPLFVPQPFFFIHPDSPNPFAA
jgi:hypothetical protein